MRIRTKPWARPELHACEYFIEEPQKYKGGWQQVFSKDQPIHLELGCGKGVFLAELAKKNPQLNFIGVDISMDILGVARRNIAETFGDEKPSNLLLASFNIEKCSEVFDAQDGIERIYIYFCNPWSRKRYHKRRLTHFRQLVQYHAILLEHGAIYFKTDDMGLFQDSIEYFEECGFHMIEKTTDLNAQEYPGNIKSEHEILFSEQGIPIKFSVARKDSRWVPTGLEAHRR